MILGKFLGITSKNELGIKISRLIKKKILSYFFTRSLPEMEGLSKETVFTSWMAKFDCILKGALSKFYNLGKFKLFFY